MIWCWSGIASSSIPILPKWCFCRPPAASIPTSPNTAGSLPVAPPIRLPDRETLWTLESGTTLTPSSPVTIDWDNGEGLVFRRTFSIDENYMFKIVDEVENKTDKEVSLLPYGRIHRYGTPKSHAYYILHEGLIGVAGDEGLKEVTYADAVKSATPHTFENITGGWLESPTGLLGPPALDPDQEESCLTAE